MIESLLAINSKVFGEPVYDRVADKYPLKLSNKLPGSKARLKRLTEKAIAVTLISSLYSLRESK